jgi:hypothetical protein
MAPEVFERARIVVAIVAANEETTKVYLLAYSLLPPRRADPGRISVSKFKLIPSH